MTPDLVVTLLALLAAALAFILVWIFRYYVTPLKSIIEEIEVIGRTNASHRLTGKGTPGLERLTDGVNALAIRLDDLQRSTDDKIREANGIIDREKNTLAMLIQGFADGVIVTSTSGQILLGNARARVLVSGDEGTPLGLGRSLFGFLDRDPVAHAMDEIAARRLDRREDCATTFMTSGRGGALLHVTMAPVTSDGNLQGYLLTLDDVTTRTAREADRDRAFLALSTAVRHSITTIRGAAETLGEFSGLDTNQRSSLTGVIHDEVLSLAGTLASSLEEHQRHSASLRSHDDIRVSDLLASVASRAEQTLDIQTRVEQPGEPLRLRADGFSLIQTLVFITERIKQATGVLSLGYRASRLEQFAAIEILWSGLPLPAATLRGWESEIVRVAGLSLTESMSGVLQRHTAEIWSQADEGGNSAMVRVLLPLAENEGSASRGVSPAAVDAADDPAGRLYEFDLFLRRDAGELAERRLDDIVFTVFDTETTGLQPASGDEIISIGAVRIVKGKIVRGDAFDQLIDPGQKLTGQSTAVHGITDAMLAGKPGIADALPVFRAFCEESVLVAHNAAFDMRFLELKESSTGIRFPMPVLDTLLLSTIVHPNQEDHRLETLVVRLGASDAGRHTALGDAMMTAEIFLKLLPLLRDRGILTLRQALEESLRSYYARIQY